MSVLGTKRTFNKEDTVLDRVYNPISFTSRMCACYGVAILTDLIKAEFFIFY